MFIILLGITLTSIALTAVYGVQEEILKLFLELSEPDVKRLYTQCEVFVSNLQVGEDDDNNSDLDNASKQINEDEVDDMDQNTMKKKKKKSKNSSNYQMSILPIIVIVCVLTLGYFLGTYVKAYWLLGDNKSLHPEIKAMASFESFLYNAYNAQTQLYMSNTMTILKKPPSQVVYDNINLVLDQDAQLHEQHSLNIGKYLDDFVKHWNSIMITNPCKLMEPFGIMENDCKDYPTHDKAKALGQGLALGLNYNLYNLYNLLAMYKKYDANPSLAWGEAETCPTLAGYTTQANNKLCLNVMKKSLEIDVMQNIYIKHLFRSVMDSFMTDMGERYSETKNGN